MVLLAGCRGGEAPPTAIGDQAKIGYVAGDAKVAISGSLALEVDLQLDTSYGGSQTLPGGFLQIRWANTGGDSLQIDGTVRTAGVTRPRVVLSLRGQEWEVAADAGCALDVVTMDEAGFLGDLTCEPVEGDRGDTVRVAAEVEGRS